MVSSTAVPIPDSDSVRACVASGGSLTLASAAVGHGKGVGVCDILQSLCSLHR